MPSERSSRSKPSKSSSSRHQDHKKTARKDKEDHKSEDHHHRHHTHHHRDNGKKADRKRHGSQSPGHRREKHRKVVVKEEPPDDYENRSRDVKRHRNRQAAGPRDENYDWGRPGTSAKPEEKPVVKEKPNFELSGKLTEDTNTYKGVVIKYNEPPEARKPKRRWRLYPFKGEEALPFIPIHRQSAYLIGRMRLVADLPIDHPSCSKQHAVLQFRLVNYEHEDGTIKRRVRPYIIDLESSNGTYVNNQRIEPRRYVELIEKDVLKFGYSTREYVLLHEDCKEEIEDDNVVEEDSTENS